MKSKIAPPVASKVAIVGAQELTRDNAPYDDLDYDIWAFSDWICYDWMRRYTAVFELHGTYVYRNHPRTPQYWDKLTKTDVDVWMYPLADHEVPGSVVYPLDWVLEMVQGGTQWGSPFKLLNCSLAYAMALAILCKYETIEVYGVELNSASYMRQSPAFAFWSGLALGRGLNLTINCSKGMFIQPLYGYEYTIPEAKLHGHLSELDKQIDESDKTKLMAIGAKQYIEHLLSEEQDDT